MTAQQTAPEAMERQSLDHYWLPTQAWSNLAEDGVPIAVEGKGVKIRDAYGNWMFDGAAGLVLVNVGHGRTEIADAVRDQLATLHYASTFHFASPQVIALAAKVASLTPPGLDHVYFTSGGAEAVETAMKVAYQYHVNNGEPQRAKFIARQDSYHGISRGALSVTSSQYGDRDRFAPILPDTTRIAPQPLYYAPGGMEESPAEFALRCARVVEDIMLAEGPDTFAAVIAEPISFSGGVAVPPDEYWPELRRVCDRHGVLLIADEVITGFGRTGRWFGMEHWPEGRPDLMTVAKGITSGYFPVGACIATDRVFETFKTPENAFRHGFTYGGHPAGGAAGLVNIDIMEREGLVENSERMGAYLLDALRALADRHPSVAEARGLGLMCGMELVADPDDGTPLATNPEAVKLLNNTLAELSLFARVTDRFFLTPPLTVTKDDLDQIVDIVDRALSRVEGHVGLA